MLLVATFSRLQAIAEHITQSIASLKSDRPLDRPIRVVSTPVPNGGEGAGTPHSPPEDDSSAPVKSQAAKQRNKRRSKNAIDDIFG